MKTGRLLLCILLAAMPVLAQAQITVNDLDADMAARVGVTVDKKIVRGVHLSLSGEGRLDDNFSSFGRFDTGLGLTYKLNDNFKFGAGYIWIQRLSSSDVWKTRHRVYADAKYTLKSGYWNFSLKERLQLTHKDVNSYKHQSTPNSLELKSRVQAAYKGFVSLTPYCYLELRNVFNDPACAATWNSVSQTFTDYVFTGYTDAYINRLRGSIGAEWKIDKHNSFDFYLLADYNYDKNVDTAQSGTTLKSISYDRGFRASLCVSYQFSF
ncbi:MAG: DUF2490 domain-containing protein [Bacteroidales bacterium]|nr:DUF2490 domain-containing protein [Bacteroidales bacterium]